MKKAIFIVPGLIAILSFSCANVSYYETRTVKSLPDNVLPGHNETEIIIRNEYVWPNSLGSDDVLLFVYINDKLTAQVAQAGSERIIVPNGKHTIIVEVYGFKRGPIRFTANSERIIFRAFYGKEEWLSRSGEVGASTNTVFLEYVR